MQFKMIYYGIVLNNLKNKNKKLCSLYLILQVQCYKSNSFVKFYYFFLNENVLDDLYKEYQWNDRCFVFVSL